jgi:hypothetical protein
MKYLIVLFLFVSCAQRQAIVRPDWVNAIRAGEETLKVSNGSKMYYRRIAGHPQLPREVSCDWATLRAEEDLRRQHPEEVPSTVEVLFFDPEHGDCAVTLSVDLRDSRAVASLSEPNEATLLLRKRTERATKYALTGLRREEFEKFADDKVVLSDDAGPCLQGFGTVRASTHGGAQVCWRNDILVGYCFLKDGQCWTNNAD